MSVINEEIKEGDNIFIPTEGKRYIVYQIKGDTVKLINYLDKEKITVTKEMYQDIKEIAEFDKDYLAEIVKDLKE